VRIHYFGKDHLKTKYIQIESEKCKACWKCIENCSQHVIAKVDIFIHKHSHIDNSKECIGCLKCVKSCEYNAITVITSNSERNCKYTRTRA